MHKDQKRVLYLDGLRGLAAICVVMTHLLYEGTGRDQTYFKLFGERYGGFPPMHNGWAGVELFFMISGFVIFLTLQRCSGVIDFMVRRWLRLFPAMLVATIATFAFSRTIQPLHGLDNFKLRDTLPGLTFLSPSYWHLVFHIDFESLEHSYWTLYVEVTFYVVFSILYFLVGWRWSVVGLIALNVFTLVARPSLAKTSLHRLPDPFEWAGCQYFFWFASGVLFAKARELASDRLFAIACVVGLAAAFATKPAPLLPTPLNARIALVCVAAIFTIAQRSNLVQRGLEWRPLVFLGFISYPLYLLHQNIGLGLIALTRRHFASVPTDLVAIPAVVVVVTLAWILARFVEPPLRNALLRLLCHLRIVRRARSACTGAEPKLLQRERFSATVADSRERAGVAGRRGRSLDASRSPSVAMTATFYFTLVVFIGLCAIFALLILIQKGRGGGISSAFGGAGGNTAFGSKTGDVLTWATSVVFFLFLIFCVSLNLLASKVNDRETKIAASVGADEATEAALPSSQPATTRPMTTQPMTTSRPADTATLPIPALSPADQPVGATPPPTTQP